ncbi:molybdopterin-dependent oxidoreductase [Streptomyces sp. NBC_00057]|uniref:molybdopterin-dependent oxidoreductase n=1 Tax=Streptomyces sp. NBC_00057 TaxID=2975634 RepID=UPI00324B5149
MNHENTGFDCPGCAWPDDTKGLHLDICENGIKHVTWKMTRKRVGREFFAAHSVTELSGWSDHDLENQGRLTEPMVYDPDSDHYVPISWKNAFEVTGRALRGLDNPNQASFYTSGRLGNEATFLYQLMARELGTNNLPDCSNMCHEASGRALQASLGTSKGTVDLMDWETADALFILGVNAASNAPRMLTALAEAYHRGAQIVHINPLVEAAATRTIVPHDFMDMALFKTTRTSTLNLQPRIGGDMALLRGMAKAILEQSATDPKALDREFIDRHTAGFEEYRALCEATPWEEIENQSGMSRADILEAARVYGEADRSIVSWCLGLTQHEHGVDTVREIVNLLLLRGNLGREGAGPSPVRGHSNVQGNRTCGIDHRPTDEFLDRLAEVCRIQPPREHGMDTVRTIQAMHHGDVKVFVGMGGNFALAIEDYDRIRDTMAQARDGFEDFNRRVRLPLGFRIKQPARELVFFTPSGRAEFSTAVLPDVVPAPGTLALGTMRSHDQWNTTIYSDNDRYRGIKNLRTLVVMNRADMRERAIADLGPVDITSTAKDGSQRSLNGYLAIPYDIPRGCAAGYMPEMNVLCALSDYSTQSDQPIMKHVKVTIGPAA